MKDIVVFGSSSSEIFDYIFGDNPQYHPLWANGWSARGLQKLEGQIKPYDDYINNLSKESIVLLHFGNVDIDFVLPYKAYNQNFYDIPSLINEMVEGLVTFNNYLSNRGFKNIYAVFTAPPTKLPETYWDCPNFPTRIRGEIMLKFAEIISTKMQSINCLNDIIDSRENPVCSLKYKREIHNHHIDFIKAQDIVYGHLKKSIIDNILPMRKPKHKKLYEHIEYDVNYVRFNNHPRPRTCR